MKASMTLTRPPVLDPVSVLRRMSPAERQSFRDAYRRECAVDAGANTAQLSALAALEKNVNAHYALYRLRPDGSVQATYTAPLAANVSAFIGPDGTVHIEGNPLARRAWKWRWSWWRWLCTGS